MELAASGAARETFGKELVTASAEHVEYAARAQSAYYEQFEAWGLVEDNLLREVSLL
jgi:hypothetical protein